MVALRVRKLPYIRGRKNQRFNISAAERIEDLTLILSIREREVGANGCA